VHILAISVLVKASETIVVKLLVLDHIKPSSVYTLWVQELKRLQGTTYKLQVDSFLASCFSTMIALVTLVTVDEFVGVYLCMHAQTYLSVNR